MQRLSISALVILAGFATFWASTIVGPLLQEFSANVTIVDLGVLFILGLIAGLALGLILALDRRHASVAG